MLAGWALGGSVHVQCSAFSFTCVICGDLLTLYRVMHSLLCMGYGIKSDVCSICIQIAPCCLCNHPEQCVPLSLPGCAVLI